MSTSVLDRPHDPIDPLVPPPRPWWVRLTVAGLIIAAVGVIGWCWRFGVVRPAPDCCGSGSSGAQIGLSHHPDAVTVTAYFYNSSSRTMTIDAADADLPGAQLVEIAPYEGSIGFEMPPQRLDRFPRTVGGSTGVWLAISFRPDQCTDVGATGGARSDDWGTVALDLSRAGDHWYPTIGRHYTLPDPVVPAAPNSLGVLLPARLDGTVTGDEHPLDIACTLLDR